MGSAMYEARDVDVLEVDAVTHAPAVVVVEAVIDVEATIEATIDSVVFAFCTTSAFIDVSLDLVSLMEVEVIDVTFVEVSLMEVEVRLFDRKDEDMVKVDRMGREPKVVKDFEAVRGFLEGSTVVVSTFSSLMKITLSLLDDLTSTIGSTASMLAIGELAPEL